MPIVMLQQGDKCQEEFNVLWNVKQSAVTLELLCEFGLKETQGRREVFFLREKCVYLERLISGSKNKNSEVRSFRLSSQETAFSLY